MSQLGQQTSASPSANTCMLYVADILTGSQVPVIENNNDANTNTASNNNNNNELQKQLPPTPKKRKHHKRLSECQDYSSRVFQAVTGDDFDETKRTTPKPSPKVGNAYCSFIHLFIHLFPSK